MGHAEYLQQQPRRTSPRRSDRGWGGLSTSFAPTSLLTRKWPSKQWLVASMGRSASRAVQMAEGEVCKCFTRETLPKRSYIFIVVFPWFGPVPWVASQMCPSGQASREYSGATAGPVLRACLTTIRV